MNINVKVDIKPLSVNQIWQGRRFKTGAYKVFEQEMLLRLPKKKRIDGQVAVNLTFALQKPNNCDLDNFIKPILDIITKKGYIYDDRRVYLLQAQKVLGKENNIKIEIMQL
jgi:Holliday junction resolvase RusA-like endonuclease